MKAIAIWHSDIKTKQSISNSPLEGFVSFIQNSIDSPVLVKVYLSGIPEGAHGFHIHEKGMEEIEDCDDVFDCCDKLGGHFNIGEKWSPLTPGGTKHGNHTGDLCFNIHSAGGIIDAEFFDQNISLYKAHPGCVINRSLVIHEDEDDQGKGIYRDEEKNKQSLITGNAGKRIACGQICIVPESKN